MRLSRPCYDKAHRCPGWAGGGMRFASPARCAGGSLRDGRYYEGRLWRWRFNRHDCGVLVLPYVVRWVDPTWLAYVLDRRIDAARYEVELRENDQGWADVERELREDDP